MEMTKRLEQAMHETRALAPEKQDEIAGVVLRLLGKDSSVIQLTPEEDADLAEAEAEVERGELASEAEVQAIWSKHGL